uniref:hypothetical protein n=1 Tax=Tropheryma whipplei TaxID=2039 RepID=UPI0019D38F84
SPPGHNTQQTKGYMIQVTEARIPLSTGMGNTGMGTAVPISTGTINIDQYSTAQIRAGRPTVTGKTGQRSRVPDSAVNHTVIATAMGNIATDNTATIRAVMGNTALLRRASWRQKSYLLQPAQQQIDSILHLVLIIHIMHPTAHNIDQGRSTQIRAVTDTQSRAN